MVSEFDSKITTGLRPILTMKVWSTYSHNQLKAKQLSTFLLVQILKLYYYFLIKFEMITLKVIDMNVWGGEEDHDLA